MVVTIVNTQDDKGNFSMMKPASFHSSLSTFNYSFFHGDAPSNLADPHFMARAEETNPVAILIGNGYEISADEPVECVGVSDASIDVYQTGDNTLYARWPVAIECVDQEDPPLRSPGLLRGGSSGGISRTVQVVPDWLGGEFLWQANH